MKMFNKILAASMVASSIAMLPSLAAAGDAPVTGQVKVTYDESKLSSEAGVASLYRELSAASRKACASLDGREFRRRAAFDACYELALSNAVVQVNRTAVTALHMRATKGASAS